MALKTGILICAFFVGSLAFPTQKDEGDLLKFFDIPALSPQGRIVGGDFAPIGSHPWLVSITQGGVGRFLICGSSLINRRTVLTAAHCLVGLAIGPGANTLRDDVRLNAGSNFISSGGQSVHTSLFAMHPGYDHLTLRNDIATVFTTKPFVLNPSVQPVAFDFSYAGHGVMARVAGWGSRTDLNGISALQLVELDVPIMSHDQCQAHLLSLGSQREIFQDQELCAFHPQGGRGVCSGDSGGPLMRLDRNQQVGIVSWTHRECADGGPDVYVRVAGYQLWIQLNTLPE